MSDVRVLLFEIGVLVAAIAVGISVAWIRRGDD